jgi:hypothetical protein
MIGEYEVMNPIVARLRVLPRPWRWAIAGAASAGLIGAITGLVIGLRVYAPTAAFAVVELGLPAAVAGAVAGGVAGLVVSAVVTAGRRIKRTTRDLPDR